MISKTLLWVGQNSLTLLKVNGSFIYKHLHSSTQRDTFSKGQNREGSHTQSDQYLVAAVTQTLGRPKYWRCLWELGVHTMLFNLDWEAINLDLP